MTGPLGGVGADALLALGPLGAEGLGSASRSPRAAAREFESLLVQQMVAAMRRTVPHWSPGADGASRKVLDGLLERELARALVRGGGLGISAVLEKQLGVPEGGAAPPGAVPGAPQAPVPPAALEGLVTSAFGPRRDPLTGRPELHAGIDLRAPAGAPIRAAADGTVVFSGWAGARAGNVVRVRQDDGRVAGYAHASRTLVEPGERVSRGQRLALVGSTGRSTGPHLHFSLWAAGVPLDPARELSPVLLRDLVGRTAAGADGEGRR